MFFLLLQLLIFEFAIAKKETVCQDSFDQIDRSCVLEHESKFSALSIPFKKIKYGQVLFYKTSDGFLGKLEVIGIENNQGDCSLYFESETYSTPKSYKTNTSLTIDNKIGIWSTKEINLDYKTGVNDLILKRDIKELKEGKTEETCKLEVIGESRLFIHELIEGQQKIQGNKLIFFAAIFLAGLSAFLFVYNYLKEEEKLSEDEKLSNESNNIKTKLTQSLIFKYSMPIVRKYILETVSKMKGIEKIKEKYKRPLANAGLHKIITPAEFYSLKFFLIFAFPLLFLLLRWAYEADIPVDFILAAMLFGYFYPELWLKMSIAKRKEEIFLSMPFVVDMLALSIEAGLDFVAAMSRVIEKAPSSPLAEEFSIMIKEIKIGSSRGEALKQLAWRVDEISVNSFCATLIAADSVGASVGPALKTISNELRNKRSMLIEAKAAKASTKIMFVMIALLVPSILAIAFLPFYGGPN